jgi:hypothetical protein
MIGGELKIKKKKQLCRKQIPLSILFTAVKLHALLYCNRYKAGIPPWIEKYV